MRGDDSDALPVGFDFDCINIDRLHAPAVVPSAGLRIGFRVLDAT